MKMLGFMVALTVFYWIMSSYAQTFISGSMPCPSSTIDASDEHKAVAAELGRLQTGDQKIRFELLEAESRSASNHLASLKADDRALVCEG